MTTSTFSQSAEKVKISKQKMEIVGYGTSEGVNRRFSIEKAKNAARGNMAMQAKGIRFRYSKDNGIRSFSAKSKATITGTQVKSVKEIARFKYLAILKAVTEVDVLEGFKLHYQKITMKTKNLNSVIAKMAGKAVEKYIKANHQGVRQLSGKTYLSDLHVSGPDSKGSFAVTAKFVIIIHSYK